MHLGFTIQGAKYSIELHRVKANALCSAHKVLCKVGQIMWVEVLDLTKKKTPMQYGGSWN
jgi:hypothetical protein